MVQERTAPLMSPRPQGTPPPPQPSSAPQLDTPSPLECDLSFGYQGVLWSGDWEFWSCAPSHSRPRWGPEWQWVDFPVRPSTPPTPPSPGMGQEAGLRFPDLLRACLDRHEQSVGWLRPPPPLRIATHLQMMIGLLRRTGMFMPPPAVPQQTVQVLEFDLTREGDEIARERLHLQANLSWLTQSHAMRRELRAHWNPVYEESEGDFELWTEFWTGPLHERAPHPQLPLMSMG